MGAQGQTGIQGQTGMQGITGYGATGVGSQGITGLRGMTGSQGDTGIQGVTGVQGVTGLQGVTGGEGFQGATGLRGDTGAAGIGETGVQGDTGVQGPTGPSGGDQGVTGLQGETGVQGITGAGTQGVTGLRGMTGPAGAPQGETGVSGLDGVTGPQGATGLGGSGTTLDGAYDFGGAGAGRVITADSGAVEITVNQTDPGLYINKTTTVAGASLQISHSGATDSAVVIDFKSTTGAHSLDIAHSGTNHSAVYIESSTSAGSTIGGIHVEMSNTGAYDIVGSGARWTARADGIVNTARVKETNLDYVNFDSGWLPKPHQSAPMVFTWSQSLSTYFMMQYVWSTNQNQSDNMSPCMAGNHEYFQYGGQALYLTGGTGKLFFNPYQDAYTHAINNFSDTMNLERHWGFLRAIAINKVPSYNSGWFAVGANTTYVKNHGIGQEPDLVFVEMAETSTPDSSDGSVWRTPVMSSCWPAGGGWYTSGMCACSSTSVSIRTTDRVARVRRYNGGAVASSTGYCRVLAYNWTPDYDSGWLSISTTLASRNRILFHNLGCVPTIVYCEIAQNSDGTGWRTHAMSQAVHSYSHGTMIYYFDDRNVSIKGGGTYNAQLKNSSGTAIAATSSYIRVKCWI